MRKRRGRGLSAPREQIQHRHWPVAGALASEQSASCRPHAGRPRHTLL